MTGHGDRQIHSQAYITLQEETAYQPCPLGSSKYCNHQITTEWYLVYRSVSFGRTSLGPDAGMEGEQHQERMCTEAPETTPCRSKCSYLPCHLPKGWTLVLTANHPTSWPQGQTPLRRREEPEPEADSHFRLEEIKAQIWLQVEPRISYSVSFHDTTMTLVRQDPLLARRWSSTLAPN